MIEFVQNYWLYLIATFERVAATGASLHAVLKKRDTRAVPSEPGRFGSLLTVRAIAKKSPDHQDNSRYDSHKHREGGTEGLAAFGSCRGRFGSKKCHPRSACEH